MKLIPRVLVIIFSFSIGWFSNQLLQKNIIDSVVVQNIKTYRDAAQTANEQLYHLYTDDYCDNEFSEIVYRGMGISTRALYCGKKAILLLDPHAIIHLSDSKNRYE